LDGLAVFPQSWRIAATQGFVAAYKLNDQQSAALYYGLAASRPGSPPFLRHLAARLLARQSLDPSELEETLRQLIDGRGAGRLGVLLEQRDRPPAPEGKRA
jgi:hypothetical protein